MISAFCEFLLGMFIGEIIYLGMCIIDRGNETEI